MKIGIGSLGFGIHTLLTYLSDPEVCI